MSPVLCFLSRVPGFGENRLGKGCHNLGTIQQLERMLLLALFEAQTQSYLSPSPTVAPKPLIEPLPEKSFKSESEQKETWA